MIIPPSLNDLFMAESPARLSLPNNDSAKLIPMNKGWKEKNKINSSRFSMG
jgi:hypothetical protein